MCQNVLLKDQALVCIGRIPRRLRLLAPLQRCQLPYAGDITTTTEQEYAAKSRFSSPDTLDDFSSIHPPKTNNINERTTQNGAKWQTKLFILLPSNPQVTNSMLQKWPCSGWDANSIVYGRTSLWPGAMVLVLEGPNWKWDILNLLCLNAPCYLWHLGHSALSIIVELYIISKIPFYHSAVNQEKHIKVKKQTK